MGHKSNSNSNMVRMIVQEDLPHNRAYVGDVVNVKAGYARNYLLPKKMAVYATHHNFRKLGIQDTDHDDDHDDRETATAAASSPSSSEDQDLKAADLLKNYLKNKTVSLSFFFFLWSSLSFSRSGLWPTSF